MLANVGMVGAWFFGIATGMVIILQINRWSQHKYYRRPYKG